MKTLLMIAAFILGGCPSDAQSHSFWNITVGQTTRQQLLEIVASRRATAVQDRDRDRIVLVDTFEGCPTATLAFDFQNDVIYAAYAQFQTASAADVARMLRLVLNKMIGRYGSPTEKSGDGDESIAALERQIRAGNTLRFAWREPQTGFIRDLFYKPGSKSPVVIGCHIIDIGVWEKVGFSR